MRFGIDVAQQRVTWDDLVGRVRLAEQLGFEGAWGFDHFQPLYGEGPGDCFEGMTTLAGLAGSTSTIRPGADAPPPDLDRRRRTQADPAPRSPLR